tara:strand:- start:381 stop:578 length:198 start_codon:yes stop_codon:yes gene_type:complete
MDMDIAKRVRTIYPARVLRCSMLLNAFSLIIQIDITRSRLLPREAQAPQICKKEFAAMPLPALLW